MTLERRIDIATEALRELPDAYRRLWRESVTDFTVQPPKPPPRVASNPNRPGSQPPPAGDGNSRATLVKVARVLHEAHRLFKPFPTPISPWLDHRLGTFWLDEKVECSRTQTEQGEVVACYVIDIPSWGPDADDLIVRVPPAPEIQVICDALTGLIGWAQTVGLPHLLSKVVTTVSRATSLLRDVGEWDQEDPPVCQVETCVALCERVGKWWRPVCSKHRKQAQREQEAAA